jgi:hypothetical protein
MGLRIEWLKLLRLEQEAIERMIAADLGEHDKLH